eukprot:NODE_29675_length_439_cov_2.657051.p2 GENE.NODE_29675_length_439_cov_2.657051~~NODE_29675_length_439_cov_2.657051.p2  ORF type:complete len:54 (+),score=3.06 NODE_29675_length_439_cov_2.657051:172-333(+)
MDLDTEGATQCLVSRYLQSRFRWMPVIYPRGRVTALHRSSSAHRRRHADLQFT